MIQRKRTNHVVCSEALEDRQLMAADISVIDGVLVITGTEDADTINLDRFWLATSESNHFTDRSIYVSVGQKGKGKMVDGNTFTSIKILALGGDDVVNVRIGYLPISTVIFGGRGNDKITGSLGKDVIHGGAGDDEIWGDDGDDQLFGGRGKDKLFGGAGRNLMFGGLGRDEVVDGRNLDALFKNVL